MKAAVGVEIAVTRLMFVGADGRIEMAWLIIITTRAQLVERHQHHCINGALTTVWWPCVPRAPMLPPHFHQQ